MLAPFFSLAMRAPARQAAFRRVAVAHVVLVSAAAAVILARPAPDLTQALAYGFLGVGMWLAFKATLGSTTKNVDSQVNQIGR